MESLRKIAKEYRILKKLDFKNELLSYFLIYRAEKKTHFRLVRQHDFFENFGDKPYNPDIIFEGKKKIIDYLEPAIANYRKTLRKEIRTIEDKMLENDWGVKQ